MNLAFSKMSQLKQNARSTANVQRIERCFVMTVDVDSWSSLLKFYSADYDPSEADCRVDVMEGVRKLLGLFEKHKIKATFFIPGEVAQKCSVIEEISLGGHEVACHGLSHEKNECLLDKKTQKQRIEHATRILEEKNGSRIAGFRAPCLRINETTLETLEECGYIYDSSIVPTFIPGYYGHPISPSKPYHPSSAFMQKKGSHKLLEIPVSVNPLVPLPLSAAWMRNLGSSWVKFGIRTNFAFGNPVVFYVHPRDVVSLPKVEGVPWHLYRNGGDSALRMLDAIILYAKRCGARFMKAIDIANMASWN